MKWLIISQVALSICYLVLGVSLLATSDYPDIISGIMFVLAGLISSATAAIMCATERIKNG